eukprot:6137241-Prymnesium_polylepis.1
MGCPGAPGPSVVVYGEREIRAHVVHVGGGFNGAVGGGHPAWDRVRQGTAVGPPGGPGPPVRAS